MSDRASEDIMAALHTMLAQSMVDKLKSGDLSASEWQAIAKFLKDNEITCEIAASEPLSTLVDQIPMFEKSPLKIVKEA
jgi:hypothetical protein